MRPFLQALSRGAAVLALVVQGLTTTNDDGPGSLRQAIADAHDGDIIGFDPTLNGQIITLTTAFGLRDPFVGIMKGVILSICPPAHLVDAPLFRLSISPSRENGLKTESQVMVDKITAVRREHVAKKIGAIARPGFVAKCAAMSRNMSAQTITV